MSALDKLAAAPFHPINRHLGRDAARQVIALRLASPKRGDAGAAVERQHDASDCPLFGAADQGRLL